MTEADKLQRARDFYRGLYIRLVRLSLLRGHWEADDAELYLRHSGIDWDRVVADLATLETTFEETWKRAVTFARRHGDTLDSEAA